MAVVVSVAAFLMTLLGGVVAMRVRDRRHLVLGLAGGLMLGVVAFDLVPKSLELTHASLLHVPVPMVGFALGFLVLHVLEQSVAIHQAHEREYAPHRHPHAYLHDASDHKAGPLAAMALVGHSFVDGLSIGLGYQSGSNVGLLVAIAVVAHDFADGFNTFTAASLKRRDRRPALVLLVLDAIAPVAGAATTLALTLPEGVLGAYLGFFSGLLLYLAAAEILPEAHSTHPRIATLGATGSGLLAILLVVSAAH